MNENSRSNRPVVFGWHPERGGSVSHYWRGRSGFDVAVSACGLTCKAGLDFSPSRGLKVCPACHARVTILGTAREEVMPGQ